MRWDQRTPGSWMLSQFVRPGNNGENEDIGEFPNYRAAVDAARRIAKFSRLEGGFMVSFCRSHKREGAMVDGYTVPISLEPPSHNPHVELTLSDGRTLWLEDLERELAAKDQQIAALLDELLELRDAGVTA